MTGYIEDIGVERRLGYDMTHLPCIHRTQNGVAQTAILIVSISMKSLLRVVQKMPLNVRNANT